MINLCLIFLFGRCNEIRARIINENYKGEDEYTWADESNEWFGNKPNIFIAHRQYYNFSAAYDI